MFNIYCLHGFLGEPNDWEFLKPYFEKANFHFVDIYRDFDPSKGLEKFAESLNSRVKADQINHLIGYSMGGRLGLKSLLKRPDLWSKAVFVSTHPGLARDEEKASRILQDGAWAMRFLTEEWIDLTKKWDQQSVFAYSGQVRREENRFNRDSLADALTHWGLGQQDDLRKPLSSISLPIYWISGANDQKFCDLSKSISLKHEESKILEIEQAGHRVPWDNQQAFINSLHDLLK